MSFSEFELAAMKLAETSEWIESDAPTPEQTRIAATVVRLADRARIVGLRIHSREMTARDWETLSDAYRAVSDEARAQLRTVEGIALPADDRLPRLSEIVSAQGADRPQDVHWVVIRGRENQDPLDERVAVPALCGLQAVPVQMLEEFEWVCDVCRERLRDIHRRIAKGFTDA